MIKMPKGRALVKEMTKALPIYGYIDKSMKQPLRKQGLSTSEKTLLKIVEVLYMGRMGGIACCVESPDGDGVLAVSVTQMCFSDEGKLYDKINKYREERIQWIQWEESQEKNQGPGERINVMKIGGDGAVQFSGDDGTEFILVPEDNNQADITANISRNSLCPCGSGKKYKKCCGMR